MSELAQGDALKNLFKKVKKPIDKVQNLWYNIYVR